jgi:hypothetical protein
MHTEVSMTPTFYYNHKALLVFSIDGETVVERDGSVRFIDDTDTDVSFTRIERAWNQLSVEQKSAAHTIDKRYRSPSGHT